MQPPEEGQEEAVGIHGLADAVPREIPADADPFLAMLEDDPQRRMGKGVAAKRPVPFAEIRKEEDMMLVLRSSDQ